MTEALTKKQLTTMGTIDTLRNYLEARSMALEIRKALPKEWSVEKFTRTVITAAQRNPRILECTAYSVAGAVIEAAQLGWELDPTLGHCALVPLKNTSRNVIECNMWGMYRGYISLAMRTAVVNKIFAKVVREGEPFQVMYGTAYQIHHEPKFPQSTDPKKWTGTYSVLVYKDGTTDFEYMDRDSVLRIKQRSPNVRSGRQSPWDTDEEAMWQKTPIRRHAKRLDLSPVDRRLQTIALLEENKEQGIVQKIGLGLDEYELLAPAANDRELPEATRAAPIEVKEVREQPKEQAKETKKEPEKKAKPKPEPKPEPQPQKKPITSKQVTDLMNLAANTAGGSFENWNPWLKKIVKGFGFDRTEDVTVDVYPKIVEKIKNP